MDSASEWLSDLSRDLTDSLGAIGLGVFIALMLAVILLPTFIALSRGVRHVASIAVINVFLGWTFVGWVVALAMAVRTKDPLPVVNVEFNHSL